MAARQALRPVKTAHSWFDPRPASELLEASEPEPLQDYSPDPHLMAAQLAALGPKLADLTKTVIWGLIILAGLVIWRR